MVTAAVALFIRYHYPEAVQASYHGLGLNVPPPSLRVLIHLSALFFFVLAIGSLALRPGPERATALGLALVAVSGLPAAAALPAAAHPGRDDAAHPRRARGRAGRGCCGQRRRPTTGPRPRWRLDRVPAAARGGRARPPESGEAVILQNHGHQIAHLRGKRDGVGFSLRILQGRDSIERLEVLMGEPPREGAPVSLRRKRGLRGHRVSARDEGELLTLGVAEFDHEVVVHDRGDTAARCSPTPSSSRTCLQLLHGWLGLWPGEGLHYIARPPADGWPLPLAELTFAPDVAGTEEAGGAAGPAQHYRAPALEGPSRLKRAR